MKKTSYILLLIVGLLAISRCVPSDFEFPNHEAELYVPILDVKLGLNHIILADTAEIFQEDTTGLVSLNYSITETRTFEETVRFEDEKMNFTIPGIPGEIPDFPFELPLYAELIGIDPGYYSSFPATSFNFETIVDIKEFNYAEFKSGIISLEITNNLPLTINSGALIELINKDESEALYHFSLDEDVEPMQTHTFNDVNLSNKAMTGSFTFRIKDLATDKGNNIQINEEDNLNVKLNFKDIAFKNASFEVPDIELPSLAIDLPIINTIGAKLQSAKFDNGNLSIDIPKLNSAIKLTLKFPSILQNNDTLSYTLGNNNINISLENLLIDFSTKSPAYNIIPVEFKLEFDQNAEEVLIEFEKPLDGNIELTNLDYDYLLGYLGTTYDLLEETESLDLFQRIVSGRLAFANPQLQITINNGTGIAAKFYDDGDGIYFRGANERLYGDEIVRFGSSLDGFKIDAAPALGQKRSSSLLINEATEPEFGEFMSLFPTYMEMRLPVKLGTDEVNFDQFIDDDAELAVTVDLDLPLNLSANRFMITDTSVFSIEFDPDKFEVQSGVFEAKVESYFPITLHIQNYFLDINKAVIDSLFESSKTLAPASIDEEGRVIEPSNYEYIISLNKDELLRLRNTKYMVSNIKLQTPDSKYVKLLSSHNIQYKLNGLLTTDININK